MPGSRQPGAGRGIAATGAIYALAGFAAGVLLGTARVLVLAPSLGDAVAVALEIPLMLTFGWIVCRHLCGACHGPDGAAACLGIGAVAFTLLMLAELALSAAAFRTAPADYLAAQSATTAGRIGLAGQMAFALIPWFRHVVHGRSA